MLKLPINIGPSTVHIKCKRDFKLYLFKDIKLKLKSFDFKLFLYQITYRQHNLVRTLGLTQVGELQFYRNELWRAPELLRMTTRPINGTQKADVYSFAIILQEIMFREEPYFIDVDPPQCMGHNHSLWTQRIIQSTLIFSSHSM